MFLFFCYQLGFLETIIDVSKGKSSDNSLNIFTGVMAWSLCLSLPFVNQEFLKFILSGSVPFYCKSSSLGL